ncbi:CocE/NonD family hydrolase [Chryseobacterium viscerum]|uniref:Hydrolase n=1 Tax=Chryseobacterium viscerum TaxID=1037377 RepID=A0A316WJD0_9FLAO|nr:CocE/NonD family hydrolase [Chryseobacterium viscerum]PWN60436.1 hydrolase [Chryseobacterium viscerum]
MKYILTLSFLLSFNSIFSQRIGIKQFNEYSIEKMEPLMSYLNSEIQKKYKEKDKSIKYDNLFRVSMSGQNYDVALSQLDSVRNVYRKSNPKIAYAMGTQYEIYINTSKNKTSKDFQEKYKEEFLKKYESLPAKSQIILPRYFNVDLEKTKKDIVASLKNDFENKDSVDLKKALLLCRNYNSYIAGQTFGLAKKYLKELDSKNFEVKDSLLINNEISIRVVLNKKITHPESTILVNSIYPDTDDVNDQKEQANYGYHSVYIYPRGKYVSNSPIEPFEHEAEDINKVIDWVIKQPWSNGKVGMIGGSYLGFSQWAAAKNIHPALKTIIPQASVGIGTIDFPMNNNIFASYCLRWINYVTNNKMLDSGFTNEDQWNSTFKKWYEKGDAFNSLDAISGKKNEIFQRWLKHPSFDSYWQKMIPYKDEYANINIPILTITGYYDSDQLGALYYLRNHYKYNKNADHYMVIGPYDHSGAQGYIKNNLRGYTIDSAANVDIGNITMEWFDYILKGKSKPSFLKDKINYQVMGTNEWKSTAHIDDFDKNKLKFYIRNRNTLSLEKEADKNFTSLKVDLKDRSDANELIKLKDNVLDNTIDHSNAVTFSSSPFEKPVEFTGNFIGNLKFSVNKKDVDLYMKLYEQNTEGKYFLLSTYYGRASYAKNAEKRELLRENKETAITVTNNEFVSKKIEKGSKLILVLGVIKSPYMQINYGTGKDVSEETIKDAADPLEIKFYNNSFIEIPISLN